MNSLTSFRDIQIVEVGTIIGMGLQLTDGCVLRRIALSVERLPCTERLAWDGWSTSTPTGHYPPYFASNAVEKKLTKPFH